MLWAQIREWNIAVRDDWQLMNFCLSLSTQSIAKHYTALFGHRHNTDTLSPFGWWEPFSAKHSTEERTSERATERANECMAFGMCVCVWSSDWVCTYTTVFFVCLLCYWWCWCWCCYCDFVCFNTRILWPTQVFAACIRSQQINDNREALQLKSTVYACIWTHSFN